jgi:hypothetical protein
MHMPGFSEAAGPAAAEAYITSLERVARVDDDLKQMIREGRGVTADQRRDADFARTRALADQSWIQRHKQGDQQARSEFQRWNIILGRKVMEG